MCCIDTLFIYPHMLSQKCTVSSVHQGKSVYFVGNIIKHKFTTFFLQIYNINLSQCDSMKPWFCVFMKDEKMSDRLNQFLPVGLCYD